MKDADNSYEFTYDEAIEALFGWIGKPEEERDPVQRSVSQVFMSAVQTINQRLNEYTEMGRTLEPKGGDARAITLIDTKTDVEWEGNVIEAGTYALFDLQEGRDEEKNPVTFYMLKADISSMDEDGCTIDSFKVFSSGSGDEERVMTLADYGIALAKKYADEDETLFLNVFEMASLLADAYPKGPQGGADDSEDAKKKPRGSGKHYVHKVSDLAMTNDEVTRALFYRDAHAVEAIDYFKEDGEWITIPAGRVKGKAITTRIRIVNRASIDELESAYQLNAGDMFWHDAVYSIANDGVAIIRGSDMLKTMGYKNPYRGEAASTMGAALQSVMKMNDTKVAIDTSGEAKAYPNVKRSYRLQSIIDGNIEVMELDGGQHDFEIRLNTTGVSSPVEALPLATYARDKGQWLLTESAEMTFKTLRRVTLEHRVMWSYVLRRLKSKTAKKTIVFDTMFRNIGMADIDARKRGQMLTQLHKMLEERKADGKIKDFTWHRNERGRAEYSVEIRL